MVFSSLSVFACHLLAMPNEHHHEIMFLIDVISSLWARLRSCHEVKCIPILFAEQVESEAMSLLLRHNHDKWIYQRAVHDITHRRALHVSEKVKHKNRKNVMKLV